MMEISNQNALSRAPHLASVASPGLTTGTSFEDAMRAADQSNNRMFGFSELGIFGYHAPIQSPPTSLSAREPGPVAAPGPKSTDSALSVEAYAMGTAPTASEGGSIEEAGPQQTGEKLISAPTFAGRSGPGGSEPRLWLTQQRAVTGDVQSSRFDAGETELGCAHLAKPIPQSAQSVDVRLAVGVEGGRASLIARDFGLADEDREGLEKKLKEALQNHGLTLSQLTLNGIATVADRSNREEA